MTTGVLWAEEQEKAKISVQQMAIPTMMIEAQYDNCVRNDIVREFFEQASK